MQLEEGDKRMVSVGLLGHGIVGSGVAHVLLQNADVVARSAGQGVVLRRIVDLRDFSKLSYGKLFAQDVAAVLEADDIDVVVECMGGVEHAYPFAKRALAAGKHFVTSNKELISTHGEELLALARKHDVQLLYEASTGGGIPAIHPIRHCLGANRLSKVSGILNGTTNFILTRMRDGGVSFEAALAQAQELGYAEQDPSADVLGHDARRKICILAHVAFGALLDCENIPAQGIDQLTRDDMLFARELNRSIKLLGVAERAAEGYTARVCPTMLPTTHPLSHVSDVFNGVLVVGDMVGEVMFFGRGAGKEATASAVIADVIDIAAGAPMTDRIASDIPFVQSRGGRARFFVRIEGGPDRAEQVQLALAGSRIVWPDNPLLRGYFGVVTGEGAEEALAQTIAALPGLAGAAIRYEST